MPGGCSVLAGLEYGMTTRIRIGPNNAVGRERNRSEHRAQIGLVGARVQDAVRLQDERLGGAKE